MDKYTKISLAIVLLALLMFMAGAALGASGDVLWGGTLVMMSFLLPLAVFIPIQRMRLREKHLSVSPLGGTSFDDKGIYKQSISTLFRKQYIAFWDQIADAEVMSMWKVNEARNIFVNLGAPYDTEGHILLKLKDGREIVLYNVANPELKVRIIKQKIR